MVNVVESIFHGLPGQGQSNHVARLCSQTWLQHPHAYLMSSVDALAVGAQANRHSMSGFLTKMRQLVANLTKTEDADLHDLIFASCGHFCN